MSIWIIYLLCGLVWLSVKRKRIIATAKPEKIYWAFFLNVVTWPVCLASDHVTKDTSL